MSGKQVAQKSSGTVHIFSTLANPQRFTVYAPPPEPGALPSIAVDVLVHGDAGIANKHLITRQGTHTSITAEEYEAIKDLQHFRQFLDSGHIKVERKEYDIDKIVSDMNNRDPGGPLTPADYAKQPEDGSVPMPVELQNAGSGWVANQLGARR